MATVPDANRIAYYLGEAEPPEPWEFEQGLATVIETIRGYTRGRGFEAVVLDDSGGFYTGTMPADLAAVVTTTAARWLRNPEALRSHAFDVAGDYSQTTVYTAPAGTFTLVEQAVLARYRRRTA